MSILAVISLQRGSYKVEPNVKKPILYYTFGLYLCDRRIVRSWVRIPPSQLGERYKTNLKEFKKGSNF